MGKTSSTRIPWENKKWKGGVVRRSFFEIFGSSILLWGFSLFFSRISIHLINPDHILRFWSSIILLPWLPMITLLCYYFAFTCSLKAWRLRECQFCMETMPGVIGGKMRGQLVLPKDLTYTKLYVQLTNMENVTLIDDCIWDTDALIPLGDIKCLYDHIITIDAPAMKSAEEKCLIAVEFTIPYYTKDETDSFYIDVEKGEGQWEYEYRWFLHVYIELEEKINLVRFRVPIFRTKESDSSIIGIAKSEDDPEKRMEYQLTNYNNLDNVLSTLGERESDTGHLEEAVTVYREALKEMTRERMPLQWAATYNNLGNALSTLGKRESGTGRLEEAVAAYHEALKEHSCDRMPLQWAATHNNLGNALSTLGERRKGEPSYVDSEGTLHYSKIKQGG